MIQSLIWRVSFPRGANIICQTILLFPLLVLKYFFGYQTPFFDFVQTKLYQAKIKENLNDSYFETLLGYDTNGEKFDSGAGGTERKQKIKATELAIRRSTVKIRTANSTRHAEIFISKSQETDTDKQIEQVLAGLGDRVPHAILFGKTGTGKTVTIMTIIYSIMDAMSPDDVKIMYVDGKGNSFEFM